MVQARFDGALKVSPIWGAKAEKTASWPAMAWAKAGTSAGLPWITVRPGRSWGSFWGGRTKAVTLWPFCRARSSNWLPVLPVAPRMKQRMSGSPSYRYVAPHARRHRAGAPRGQGAAPDPIRQGRRADQPRRHRLERAARRGPATHQGQPGAE